MRNAQRYGGTGGHRVLSRGLQSVKVCAVVGEMSVAARQASNVAGNLMVMGLALLEGAGRCRF